MNKYQSLIESNLSSNTIFETINYSLNIMARNLVIGIQGDTVIDGNKVWVFTDSVEHAKRVIQELSYDQRVVGFDEELKIVTKTPNPDPDVQEQSSVKILLGKQLDEEQIAFYKAFGVSKHFYLKEEYELFW